MDRETRWREQSRSAMKLAVGDCSERWFTSFIRRIFDSLALWVMTSGIADSVCSRTRLLLEVCRTRSQRLVVCKAPLAREQVSQFRGCAGSRLRSSTAVRNPNLFRSMQDHEWMGHQLCNFGAVLGNDFPYINCKRLHASATQAM